MKSHLGTVFRRAVVNGGTNPKRLQIKTDSEAKTALMHPVLPLGPNADLGALNVDRGTWRRGEVFIRASMINRKWETGKRDQEAKERMQRKMETRK